jgi:hypothetical protein
MRPAAHPHGTLSKCVDSVQALFVELPDHRLVCIQSLEPDQDDDLVDRMFESKPSFRKLVAESNASPWKPFPRRRL